tara:strand:- start:127 stop:249 length:123 start_codon:yes stop_codon:yes gene_type:complete
VRVRVKVRVRARVRARIDICGVIVTGLGLMSSRTGSAWQQ